jgi:predicted permease
MDIRDANSYQILARLREGVSIERAQADLTTIGERLEEAYPDTNEDIRASVVPLHILLYGDAGGLIILVLLATGAVLLIACGNIAGFLLARGMARQTEMAVRASLGAGKGRIVRQLLTESLLLALGGGAAALLLATGSLGGLKALIPPELPRTGDIRLDSGVLLFALLLSLATGVLFGLAPALAAARTQLTDALKEGGRAGGGRRRKLMGRNAFVVAQIALSLSLANAGLLLIQSYASLRQVDQGFDGAHTLTMSLTLGGERYDEASERETFFDQLLPRLEAIPGVRAAGIVSKLPLLGGTNGNATTEEAWQMDPTGYGILTESSYVAGDYFGAMGISLLAGRMLEPQDAEVGAPGILINETAANQLWPDQNPLGKRLGWVGDSPTWRTVVGVVGDVRQAGPERTPRAEMYAAYGLNRRARMIITLNTAGDPRDLIVPAREAVLSVDPLQPVTEIRTMDELLDGQLSSREFSTLLIGLFSLLAVLLAAAGIYGVVSFFVAQRTREMGLRMALGAARAGLIGLVLRRALTIVFWGILFGMGGVWVSTRVISGLLFGVTPLDVPTLLTGLGIMLGAGLIAALVPGMRGTRLSPVRALRTE